MIKSWRERNSSCEKFVEHLQIVRWVPPRSHFLDVLPVERNSTSGRIERTNKMVVKLEVFKTVHNTWPAKNGMAAGESYDLLCIDVSQPPEHRMEEMLFYRTKIEEREAHYVNGTGKTITVGVAKIRHADKGGKATIIGTIIPEAIKK